MEIWTAHTPVSSTSGRSDVQHIRVGSYLQVSERDVYVEAHDQFASVHSRDKVQDVQVCGNI